MWLKPNRPAGEWPIALIASSALGLVRSQPEKRPRWQNQHWPQLIVNGTTTRSPILRLVTSEPSSIDLAHVLVAEDVAALHRRLIAVEEVEVRAADRTGGDLDHGVARVLDLRIGDGVNTHIAFPMPAKCAHQLSPEIVPSKCQRATVVPPELPIAGRDGDHRFCYASDGERLT